MIGTKKSAEKINTVRGTRRRYPDDGKRMLVELENTPHHAEVTLKMALPISVGEHNIGSAVRAMLVEAWMTRPRYG